MKQKNIFISIGIIILTIIVVVILLQRHVVAPMYEAKKGTPGVGLNPSFVFFCPSNKSMTVMFHLPEDKTIDIDLSDGRSLDLAHVVSADGARYANADESVVFWNKGLDANLTENGITTYESCTAKDPRTE